MTDKNLSDEHDNKLTDEAQEKATAENAKPDQELSDTDLNDVSGGLLPAVQAAREAARRLTSG